MMRKQGADAHYNILQEVRVIIGSKFCKTVFAGMLIFVGAHIQAQNDDSVEILIDGTIHTPGEIVKLQIESKVTYVIKTLKDSMDIVDTFPQPYFDVDFYLSVKDDGSSELRGYQVNDTVSSALDSAEAYFHRGEYQEAISGYREALNLYPDFHGMYTWIAQSFRFLGQTDSSLYYYKLSIEKNYVDFHAHWFLGNLYWDMNDTVLAIQHLTIAHIFNRFHERLKNRLIEIREVSGNPWQEWEFRPQYKISQSDHKVDIELTGNWMLYAMTMSLWEYEPGYAETMMGRSIDGILFNPEAEREAIGVWTMGEINRSKSDSTELAPYVTRIRSIILDGNIMSMVYYELAASRWPKAILLMPREVIDDLVNYLNTYH